jgi:Arc/MetJ-type ribon-helix-helix transcriptional regulator
MQVTLEPELEQQVQHKIASGEYPSTDALLNAALRRFLSPVHDPDDPLPLEEMRRELMIAVEQEARGEYGPFDAEEIKAAGRRLLAERQARK